MEEIPKRDARPTRLSNDSSISAMEGAEGVPNVTVGERILVHLSGFLRHADSYECPVEMTQDGIAAALLLSRAHVALELKRLKSTGKVQERMAHVANARSRRKVYELTPAGQEISRRMREHARARTIELSAPEGRRTVLGAEAIDALRHAGLREAEAVQRILASDVVELPRAEPIKPAAIPTRVRPDRGDRGPPRGSRGLRPRDRRPPCEPRRRRPPPCGGRTSAGCQDPRRDPHAADVLRAARRRAGTRRRTSPRRPRRRIRRGAARIPRGLLGTGRRAPGRRRDRGTSPRPRALRRERPRRGSGRDGAVRPRHGPRGPRRRLGGSPPHVRGLASPGALPGEFRGDPLAAPATRAPRAPAPPRRGIPVARPREGVLPPTDGRPPTTGGTRPRGLLLGEPTRRPRGGVPSNRIRGPRGRGRAARRRRTGLRGERSRRRPGGRPPPRSAGFEARRPPGRDADVPWKVRRGAGGPRADRKNRNTSRTPSGAHPTRTDRESTRILPGREVDPHGSGPGGRGARGPGGRGGSVAGPRRRGAEAWRPPGGHGAPRARGGPLAPRLARAGPDAD